MANQSYIKHVQLKGYKSIKNLEADFLPGLNIIIGDNGSGKSNFFKFIDGCFNKNYDQFDEFDATIDKINANNGLNSFNWKTEKHFDTQINLFEFDNTPDYKLKVNEPRNLTFDSGLQLIEFGLPKKNYLLGDELTIIYNTQHFFGRIKGSERSTPQKFVYAFVSLFKNHFFDEIDYLTDETVYKSMNIFLKIHYSNFFELIKIYSPILDTRLSNSLRLTNLDKNTIEIRNVVLEYLINDEWFSWDSLSDGTKRIIHLIFLTCGLETEFQGELKRFTEIIFLEEPEIGIHPHQLHLLMQFLKERSEVQQIFISTHSPQVLDILGEEDLDRITIAEIQPKEGTKFRKLNEKEVTKAKLYLNETGMLSDLWRFTDFQRTKKY